MKIKMFTTLDTGIYKSDRDAWAIPEIMEVTRANLAYMLDWRDYRLLETRGCFGNIGMGTTEVYLVDNNNETLVTDENESDIQDSIKIEGELSRNELDEITGKVWDGNNHVFFYPKRSNSYCNEDDIEHYAWGYVKYYDEHTLDGVEISPGWILLGGLDEGGYWNDSKLSREEFDKLEGLDEPPAKIERFADDENDTVALFATEENYKIIRKYFGNEDEN